MKKKTLNLLKNSLKYNSIEINFYNPQICEETQIGFLSSEIEGQRLKIIIAI